MSKSKKTMRTFKVIFRRAVRRLRPRAVLPVDAYAA